MVCTGTLLPFLLHHSLLALRLTVVSARRGSLRNDDDGIDVVLREVAVDALPGHECKHSSGPAPLANAASITRWLASASTSPMRMWFLIPPCGLPGSQARPWVEDLGKTLGGEPMPNR